ncbi:ribosomal protein S27-domain-containing protein [Daldinia decipiens]|uniref:ribosomal protein S27-domain-containing protein n=1 Tax=Daldinia decipiens TaxID=326647 RepID=UPI0020C39273|nr:ribosomal protein S27-domain-containing protein [Daldinia decipiens]KAI1658804.1 ribosomal protein S27-domain-containing protein [Daldinia decipiens]
MLSTDLRDFRSINHRRFYDNVNTNIGKGVDLHLNTMFTMSVTIDEMLETVLAVDLLNPSPAAEAKKHKLKTLVPSPRSFFMDVKCPGCFTITTVFSHAQTVVICQGCTTVLCQPTGGKARLTEGCSFRRK